MTGDGSARRYPIRVDPLLRGLFAVLGAGARRDVVEVADATVQVRLGWMFRSTIARSAIVAAHHHADMRGGWGAHGWWGRWLVNGSSKGIGQGPDDDHVVLADPEGNQLCILRSASRPRAPRLRSRAPRRAA